MRQRHTVKHDLTRKQAHEAINTALQVYCRKFPQYEPRLSWVTQNRAETEFRVKGRKLVAEVEIHDDRLDMAMDVPLFFLPFRGPALRVIENEIRKWLARAKAGELRPPA